MASEIQMATAEVGRILSAIGEHRGPKGTVGADGRAVLRAEAQAIDRAIKAARSASRALETASERELERAADAERAALLALAAATDEGERVRKMWTRTLPESAISG